MTAGPVTAAGQPGPPTAPADRSRDDDRRRPATLRLPTGLAVTVVVVYLVSAVVLLVAVAVSGASWEAALADHQLHNIDLAGVLGVLILRRNRGHVIGWLLVGVDAFEWPMLLARSAHFLGLPGAELDDPLAGLFVTSTFFLLVAIPQLFPDGRLLSRRWWPLLGFGVVATAFLTTVFLAVPTGPESAPDPGLFVVGFVGIGVAAISSVVPAALRFHRSSGTERQQFKWVIYGLVVSGVLLSVGGIQIATAGESLTNSLITLVAQGLIPVAFAVALLRHRLYDIDIVINKTVVFVALAAFITAVYAVVVVGLGWLLPFGDRHIGLSIAATALVAIAFEPVRARVQHAANRLVYGVRATPYEALAAMTAHLGSAPDGGGSPAALGEAARLLADGTGAARAVVWVARGGYLDPVGTAGTGTGVPDRVPAGTLPEADLVQPVHDGSRMVGALSLTKRPGEGVSSADRKLVRELAGQATLLLANTRLRSRLRERAVELRASRRRLLAAQDRARHGIERDLHDGAQQEVVAAKIRIGLARSVAGKEGATGLAADLADAAAVADRAVEALREVARGIYPPLLESDGLAAALGAQTRRSDLAVTLLDRGTGRYPREVESTAYFCVLEAVQNAGRHARASQTHIELDVRAEALVVTVTDDGTGFDPDRTPHGTGLTHMTDRADAAGGTLDVTSRPGRGTTVVVTLPTGG